MTHSSLYRPRPTKPRAARMGDAILLLVAFLAILWGLEIMDEYLWHQWLNAYGIIPRDDEAIFGVFTAPFLHAGFDHLTANTVPLAVLGFLICLRGTGAFLLVSVLVAVLGGLGVWLVGEAHSVHIGASGLIFGYLGFLLAAGFIERSVPAMALTVIVGILYGSALWGVLPGQPGVSWEGHLFGFVAGVIVARLALGARRVAPL